MGAIITRGARSKRRFYAQYKDTDGVRRTQLLRGCTSTETANKLLASIEVNVTEGRAGLDRPTAEQQARRALTVRQLGEKFMEKYTNPKIKDLDRYKLEAGWKLKSRIGARIGHRAVASLTVADLERFRDDLLAGDDKHEKLSAASVTRTLALFSKMFAWGKKQGLLAGESPTRGCVRPSSASSIDYLSRDEVMQLLARAEDLAQSYAAAPQTRLLYFMVATAIYTGMRKGELFGLRWTDVHLDGKAPRIDVARSYGKAPKSGKVRHLPVHPELARVLRQWKEACPKTDGGLVFPVDGGRGPLRMGLERDLLGLADVLRLAGCHVPDHPWHALRHTFASHFMMAGGNVLTLQKLLGHSTLAMTLVYAHLAPDHLAAEIARMTFSPAAPATTTDLDEERRRRARADA